MPLPPANLYVIADFGHSVFPGQPSGLRYGLRRFGRGGPSLQRSGGSVLDVREAAAAALVNSDNSASSLTRIPGLTEHLGHV